MKTLKIYNGLKHSIYIATNKAGYLRNGRPKRPSQNFGDLKKQINKNICRKEINHEE